MTWRPFPTPSLSMRSPISRLKEWVWSINHRHVEQKCTICSTSKPFWAIQSPYKPVFHRYLSICCAYSPHKRLELEIWRFSCRRRRRQQRQTNKPIALPLAHAQGVITVRTLLWKRSSYLDITFSKYFHSQMTGHYTTDIYFYLVVATSWCRDCSRECARVLISDNESPYSPRKPQWEEYCTCKLKPTVTYSGCYGYLNGIQSLWCIDWHGGTSRQDSIHFIWLDS